MLDVESWKLCWHITRRNWRVYRKNLVANISPTIADPAFYLLSLGLGLGAMVAEIEGHTYVQYLAPGMAVSTALFTSFFETSYGFFVRLTYERIFDAMLATPIGVREIIFGEFIWVTLKGAVMATGVAAFLACLGLMPHWELLPGVLLVGGLVAMPCGAIGLLAAAWASNMNQFQTVYSFLIAPLFFFSGLFFPLAQMPSVVRGVAYFFPLAHGVRLAQAIFWNEEVVSTFAVHGSALVLQSIVLGACAYWAIEKKLVS
jgi:lipooligosaccharide transport system permease protein